MTSRGQLEHLIREGQVLSVEPDPVSFLELFLRYLSGRAIECFFGLLPLLSRRFLSVFDSLVCCGFRVSIV